MITHFFPPALLRRRAGGEGKRRSLTIKK